MGEGWWEDERQDTADPEAWILKCLTLVTGHLPNCPPLYN